MDLNEQEPIRVGSNFNMNIKSSQQMYSWYSKALFRDDYLPEEYENLLEKYPSKDISEIKKLEKCLGSFTENFKIADNDILEICLEKHIHPEEILLMDVMFKNSLKTASRNGITILDIDQSLEIRNNEEKFLSPEEREDLEAFISEDKSQYLPQSRRTFPSEEKAREMLRNRPHNKKYYGTSRLDVWDL